MTLMLQNGEETIDLDVPGQPFYTQTRFYANLSADAPCHCRAILLLQCLEMHQMTKKVNAEARAESMVLVVWSQGCPLALY
jgi:hypothetical protein